MGYWEDKGRADLDTDRRLRAENARLRAEVERLRSGIADIRAAFSSRHPDQGAQSACTAFVAALDALTREDGEG